MRTFYLFRRKLKLTYQIASFLDFLWHWCSAADCRRFPVTLYAFSLVKRTTISTDYAYRCLFIGQDIPTTSYKVPIIPLVLTLDFTPFLPFSLLFYIPINMPTLYCTILYDSWLMHFFSFVTAIRLV